MNPADASETVLVHTAHQVGNVRDGKIPYAWFAGYFNGLLAKTRTVKFNIWHCFVGSAGPGQVSAVKRIADAFGAAGQENVEVMGYTGRALFQVRQEGGKLKFAYPFGEGARVTETSSQP